MLMSKEIREESWIAIALVHVVEAGYDAIWHYWGCVQTSLLFVANWFLEHQTKIAKWMKRRLWFDGWWLMAVWGANSVISTIYVCDYLVGITSCLLNTKKEVRFTAVFHPSLMALQARYWLGGGILKRRTIISPRPSDSSLLMQSLSNLPHRFPWIGKTFRD